MLKKLVLLPKELALLINKKLRRMGIENRAKIIARLRNDILLLQGFRPAKGCGTVDAGLGQIVAAFPQQTFPIGAVHEFITDSPEDIAATTGFISCVVGHLMCGGRSCVWIGPSNAVFPVALKFFGIEPESVLFVRCERDREILWVAEEALRCKGLAAVVVECRELSFTASRRLQLITEQSAVTGLLFRHQPRSIQANACVSRWRIRSLASSEDQEGLPGVGHPRWSVILDKVRNGWPGSWQVEYTERLAVIDQRRAADLPALKKIG